MSKTCTEALAANRYALLKRLQARVAACAVMLAAPAALAVPAALAALAVPAALAALTAAVVPNVAIAAPAAVEAFDKATWPALVRNAKQPAIVVFTSVTCTYCPGAIASLAKQRAAKGSQVPLLVVSMDADDDALLLRDAHYAPADRLFAFRGNPQALQFAVNPEWRGMTPYVAYVDGKGGARFVLGEPRRAVLEDWLRARR